MNGMMKNMTGMAGMTDQVIATDFLLSAKTGIKNIAIAITETSTPVVRDTLRQYLNDAIDTHQQIFNYMVDKGYYHPKDLAEQLRVDFAASQTAMNLPQPDAPQA